MPSRPLTEVVAHLRHLADPAAPGIPDAELLRRFAESRDEAAFELLVWRHGGMVLATCRRVLGRSPDADDAFQATFLALVRRAGSVRRGVVLGGWLYRVAVRAALRLRATTDRPRVDRLPEPAAPPDPLPDDTAAVLDEEIARLPEKLRVAFVLCYLEGHTNEEAAERLGCPKGTVLSRLSRARERLRDSLTRRGLAAPAAVLAGAVVPTPLTAALVGGVVVSVGPFAAGHAGGVVPARVLTLTHGVLRTMRINELTPLTALTAAVALVAGAALVARPDAPAAPLPAARPVAAAPVQPAPPVAPREYRLESADTKLVQVDEVAFSPDGKWGVAAGLKDNGDAAVVIWEAATGKLSHTLTKPDGVGAAMGFSPDGRLFATSNIGDANVTVWSVGTWKAVATLDHPMATDTTFSADGRALLTRSLAFAGKETINELKLWDAATGKLALALAPRRKEKLGSAALSPDGKTLAVGVSTGAVRLLDAKAGKSRTEITAPEVKDAEVLFSPDGAALLTWPDGKLGAKPGEAGTPRLYDAATGKALREFKGSDQPIRRVAFSADGKRVVAVGARGSVWAWDAATGKLTTAIEPKAVEFATRFADFTPNASLVAVSGDEGGDRGAKPVAVLYSLADGKELARLPGARAIVFDHDGKSVAAITGTGMGPAGEGDRITVRDVRGLSFRPEK